MKEAKQVYLDTKLNLQDTVEKQAEMAKALNPKKKKYGKAHPEDKTAKKQEMRKDPDGITKRSYSSIDPEPEKETLTKQQEELAAIEHLRIPDEMRRTMGDRKLSREEEINRILALIEDEV